MPKLPALNHPKKGSSIKVEPIRDLKAIKRIKKLREDSPRDLCLFTFGINTAYRAGELLSLTVGQVEVDSGSVQNRALTASSPG